jgi:hypothetical protein
MSQQQQQNYSGQQWSAGNSNDQWASSGNTRRYSDAMSDTNSFYDKYVGPAVEKAPKKKASKTVRI